MLKTISLTLVFVIVACGNGSKGGGGDAVVTEDAPVEDQLVLAAQGSTARTGVAGDLLSDDCVVILTRGGNPVAGTEITFTVMTGGGKVTPVVVTTGSDGTAATKWKLGFGGLSQLMQATTANATAVDFTVTATVRPIVFATATRFAAGNLPWALAVGHFDSQPGLDLVVSLRMPNKVAVLPGLGSAAFGAAKLSITLDGPPRGLAVANFNNDAYDDVAVAIEILVSGEITTFLGTSTGDLGARLDVPAGSAPWDVVVADFDGNGTQDLAVSNRLDDNIEVLAGVTGGTFGARTSFTTGNDPRGIAIADVDGSQQIEGGRISKTNHGFGSVTSERPAWERTIG